MIHIVKKVPRADEALIEAFKAQATATAHEAMGWRGALDSAVKPLDRNFKTCGRALTVHCHPGDNLMLIKAISMAQAGDVIVMHAGGLLNSGPFGEVLATECLARGVAGLVTDGSVRDSEALIGLGFPVFAAGLCIRGTAKATLGRVNHPVICGGILVNPGDIVLGDADGVLALPLAEAPEILAACKAREDKEGQVMAKLRNGASLFDLYGYQAVMERLGCREEE